MREALRIKTVTGTHLINSQLISIVVFNDMARVMKVGLIGVRGYKFPYDDLLELNELKQAYCYDDLNDFGDGAISYD